MCNRFAAVSVRPGRASALSVLSTTTTLWYRRTAAVLPMNDLIARARAFSTEAHQRIDQRRKYTNQPYQEHLKAVAALVADVTDDPQLIAAAWLHDTVEDTPATFGDLERAFGPAFRDLVDQLTDVSKPSDGNSPQSRVPGTHWRPDGLCSGADMGAVIEIRDAFGELLRRYEVPAGAAGLRGAVLEGAELTAAQLAGADLEGSDLYWARLFRANLEGANLRRADLRGADLKEANLRDADLQGADLGRDNLGGATALEGTDLRGARLDGTRTQGARYDQCTRFPTGFSPEAAGMIRTVED
jgi:hypothetical protein